MFLIPSLIAIAQTLLILCFFNYETPMYLLLNRNDEAGAKVILRKIYYEEDIENIISYIKKTNQTQEVGKFQ